MVSKYSIRYLIRSLFGHLKRQEKCCASVCVIYRFIFWHECFCSCAYRQRYARCDSATDSLPLSCHYCYVWKGTTLVSRRKWAICTTARAVSPGNNSRPLHRPVISYHCTSAAKSSQVGNNCSCVLSATATGLSVTQCQTYTRSLQSIAF